MNVSTRRVAYVTDIYMLRLGLVQGQYSAATAISLSQVNTLEMILL